MARATNAFADEPSGKIERGRGGFLRGFNDVASNIQRLLRGESPAASEADSTG